MSPKFSEIPQFGGEGDPGKKIFAMSERLRLISFQLDRDIEEVTEKTFDNVESLLVLVEELQSLDMSKTLNTGLSDEAVKEDDEGHLKMVLTASSAVDIMHQSVEHIASIAHEIRSHMNEAKLQFQMKGAAYSQSEEAHELLDFLLGLREQANMLTSGIGIVKVVLTHRLFTESVTIVEREVLEKNIQNKLKDLEYNVRGEFSIPNDSGHAPMTSYNLAVFKDTTGIHFQGTISFSGSENGLTFSGDYDAEKDAIKDIVFLNKEGVSFRTAN